uniref:CRM domain-containing protein n=1 Tax=Lactuca sativa TaxID=4236 RepID=A0A9R1VHT2_LACSA|nr:hypothetical protein LSAT_V11C500230230 [Lactuca sativa]
MLKLFTRQRHDLHSHSRPPILFIFCHLIQSHFEDDPPFSPILKTANPLNQNNKKLKGNASNKNPKNEFPTKSNLPFDFRFFGLGFGFGSDIWSKRTSLTATVAPLQQAIDITKVEERNAVLGNPLSEEEVSKLVERYRHSDCSGQINLGKGGVTHNMIDDIHNHWKKAEGVRIKCLGVPTLDMDNVCYHLENRPLVPLMRWKPYPLIYPKIIKNVADGLTFEETKEMRNRGLSYPPLIRLIEQVVNLDCAHVGMSDCKMIAVKLRDLVPCVPILYKHEQIILWRGKKAMETALNDL